MFLHSVEPPLVALQEEGLESIIAGATVLILRYPDHVLDLPATISVLVPCDRIKLAAECLRSLGWISTLGRRQRMRERLSTGAGDLLEDSSGHRIRLAWRLFPAGFPLRGDGDLWTATTRIDLRGVSARTPGPADQLLHACVQLFAAAADERLLRAIDAMLVLRAADGEVDWDRFRSRARRFGLLASARRTLHYLEQHLEITLGPMSPRCPSSRRRILQRPQGA